MEKPGTTRSSMPPRREGIGRFGPAPTTGRDARQLLHRTQRADGVGDVPLQAPPRSQPADGCTDEQASGPVLDELRQKIHHHLIDELGPILYDKRLSEDDLRRRVHEQLRGARPGARAPVGGRQGTADPGRLRRHPRLRPDRPAAEGREHLRGHGQRPGQRLRGAQRQGREDRRQLRGRDAPAASSTRSSARSAGASTSRRRSATPASRTAPVSAR